MNEEHEPKFAVIAEKEGLARALYLHSLTFGRLMDDVVVPYEGGDAFFVDGVSVERKQLTRIKIVRQSADFDRQFREPHHFASRPSSGKFVEAQDYPTRLEVLFRGQTEDVTGQIINAFKVGIRPRMKDYLPRRDELISAALSAFLETTKNLAASGGA